MRVELLTIGDELLLGFTLDTNGPFLARALAAMGVTVAHRASVGDDADAVARAIREALDRTGAVITTGGLGPTADDRTREAVAAAFGTTLVLDDAIADGLRALWRSRGFPGELPASNLRQAMVPQGATVLPNAHGSAPGLWLEDARGRWVAMVPGVPREMRGMWGDTLEPRVRADALLAVAGPHAYGLDDTDLAAVVLARCREKGLRLAVAESCTGGMLGMRLTAVPGSSDVLIGGVIAYDNVVKAAHLGVRALDIAEHGAVSELVARYMAHGARLRFGADIGVAITGVAGPGGGTEAKPVGTVWVAADLRGEVRAVTRRLPGDRHEVRQRAAQMALDLVRRGLEKGA